MTNSPVLSGLWVDPEQEPRLHPGHDGLQGGWDPGGQRIHFLKHIYFLELFSSTVLKYQKHKLIENIVHIVQIIWFKTQKIQD